MNNMLQHDEASKGVDALSILAEPRLTPFFPIDNGRESGWIYWITPALVILGPALFVLRITATITGVLTLAAVYLLARETLEKRMLALFAWMSANTVQDFRNWLAPPEIFAFMKQRIYNRLTFVAGNVPDGREQATNSWLPG